MINVKHLQAFVAVADLGTFRRAAQSLNTTQPNISNRIAQLETLLGGSLMDRDAGSVRLTAKGARMLPAARAVLASVDAFVASADDTTLFDGVLRLGVSELVAHTWLRGFLLQMKDRFPNIVVELTVDLSANLSDALFARDLDLVFQNGPFDRTAKGTVPLGQADYVWVSAPTGTPRHSLSAQDMAKHRILTHARATTPYRQLEQHFHRLGLAPRLVPGSTIGACLQMALDGLSIACLPHPLVKRHLSAGHLVNLPYDWHPDPLRFAARHPFDPTPTPVTEAIRIAQGLSPPD